MKPIIFNYLDYRHYLSDLFESAKQEKAGFSYRELARIAGSSSPNFLQLIINRKLNIQGDAVRALSEWIGLTNKEEAYFETLVAFDHAKSHEEKDKHFRRILATREYVSVKQLERKQYDYFSHWYFPVVRELLVHPDYPDDPAWIGERLIPAVSAAKVRKAIESLESLGLIRRNDQGRWMQIETSVSTPSEVFSLAVINYHRDVISLASEALERFDADKRDIRSVTIGTDSEGFEEIKRRMEAFWKEMLAFGQTQNAPRQVFQINLQAFPLSVANEDSKKS